MAAVHHLRRPPCTTGNGTGAPSSAESVHHEAGINAPWPAECLHHQAGVRTIVYSLVETAKANDIDPYDYLFYTLSVLPYFGKSPSHERLETLMPWAGEIQQRYNEKLQPETE